MRDVRAREAEVAGQIAGRTRSLLIGSTAAIGWAAFTMVILHIVSSHDPVRDTISSYAITDRGGGMLEASVLSLAIGSLVLLGALLSSGAEPSRTARILLLGWASGLIVAALFPASFTASTDPTSGKIHQYASLIAFVSLPGVGYSLADRLREAPELARTRGLLLRLTALSVLSLAVFGLSYVAADFPHTPVLAQISDVLPVGLAQRLALLIDLALLVGLSLLAARTARLRQPEPG
ncbi:DUF998 domain-containing protein [Amycolatopsis cihanbeyliensis]|uniref:Uncharacterized protein DUF998 n=1 Tax=Amycolatopsis cihanbeyliensis TaxID=1128664 RepID=A0A542DKE4_AMYCI|nr:DUF998 domain-containing protein [Amycolatopsis cihanbeyliensis]TQJ03405.1 uncharacterized protein DUF998 [Amycolatopsis cihanbeyliensis]